MPRIPPSDKHLPRIVATLSGMKADRYSRLAVILHWVIALLLIPMLFFGEDMIEVEEGGGAPHFVTEWDHEVAQLRLISKGLTGKDRSVSPRQGHGRPTHVPATANTIPSMKADALSICALHGNRPDALIEILHDLQHAKGHVPEADVPVIAKALNLSKAEVHGVITFYHDFSYTPLGRHLIMLCRAEACQSMGGEKTVRHAEKKLKIRTGETTPDGKVTLKSVYCLGNCALSPAAMVDGHLKARVSPKAFDAILAGLDGGKA
jgi:formate dehydrogenase subunit gamma